jgi:hypothetical protein
MKLPALGALLLEDPRLEALMPLQIAQQHAVWQAWGRRLVKIALISSTPSWLNAAERAKR